MNITILKKREYAEDALPVLTEKGREYREYLEALLEKEIETAVDKNIGSEQSVTLSLQEALQGAFYGMWQDRDDIADGQSWVNQKRDEWAERIKG